jgi:hypothetical protein
MAALEPTYLFVIGLISTLTALGRPHISFLSEDSMKNYLVVTILLTASAAMADNGSIQCDWIGSDGHHYVRYFMDTNNDFSQSFPDSNLSEVKYSFAYSKFLKTIDTSVKDEDLQVEAYSTEWMNTSEKGAHSAARLTTKKGVFTLSCSLH